MRNINCKQNMVEVICMNKQNETYLALVDTSQISVVAGIENDATLIGMRNGLKFRIPMVYADVVIKLNFRNKIK